MNSLIALYATFTSMVSQPRRDEKGQGTLEYVGIVIVAGILVLAIVTALGDGNVISEAVSNGIDAVVNAGG